MKKIFLLSVAATLISSLSFAKIWRVNNNAGVIADFTTAQQANNSALVMNGDTIHLEPSAASYGTLAVTKRLTWISIGAFLVNYPNEQYHIHPGSITSLEVSPGSNSADNSSFHVFVIGQVTIDANNITLYRCYIGGDIVQATFVGSPNAHLAVIGCYVVNGISIIRGSGHIVSNNIIGRSINSSSGATSSVRFVHNVINALSATGSNVNNAVVENNIFNKSAFGSVFNNSSVRFNISSTTSTVLPTGPLDNNTNGVTMTNVFVDPNGTIDSAFVLKAGINPAIGTGISGVNLGAFGGASPFRLSVQPPVPAIYGILAPATPSGNTLTVTFSTKNNN
jgi:hypothetical protein